MAYSLAFVPTDILVSILAFIDCVSLIRVYKCGDNRLNDRLLKSVTRFDLVYSNYVTMKFPIIIRHFTGLKSLTVRLYNNSERPKCDYDLTSLPNSLTSLQVPQERPLFDHPTSSSLEGLQTPVLDLSALFPNLVSLVTPIGSYQPSATACLEWIEKLPRNLIKMRMSSLSLGPEHIAALPRSLSSLKVRLNMLDNDIRHWNFPPDLHHLSLPCRLHCDDFEKYLPLQLQSLALDPSKIHRKPNTRFENLPRSLKVLEGACVTITSSTCFDGLPKGLERLTLGRASMITTDVVYPPCLKEIYGSSSFSPSDFVSFISSLPSGVEEIHTNLLHTLPSSEWHLLPRKLRKMSIRSSAVLSEEHTSYLPPGLKEVQLHKPSEQLIQLLPKNLTSLTLGKVVFPFNPSILNSLYQLKTLDLRSGVTVNINDFSNFTPKLKSLALLKACSLEELDLRLPWASRLTHFQGETYLHGHNTEERPSDNDLIGLETEIRKTNSFETLAWWTHFSHTLTSIIISGNISTLYSSHISLLPPHLTAMNTPEIFIDEHLFLSLRRLPSAIQSANFSQSVIYPGTNQQLGDIEALPPNLTRLGLKRLEDKDETIVFAKKLRSWLKIFVYSD